MIFLIFLLLFPAVAVAQTPADEALRETGSWRTATTDELEWEQAGWTTVGTFRGAVGVGLLGQFNNQIFEDLQDGSLYDDLGDLRIGIGESLGPIDLDWDNSFNRRVLPQHEDLPLGAIVGADDTSGYLSLKTLTTRGRVEWDYIEDVVKSGGVGVQVEIGTSLTLAVQKEPLRLGERPLEEALAERGEDRIAFPEHGFAGGHGLLRTSTLALERLVDRIANALGKNSDTERAALFYDEYADPVTLFIDLGLPLEMGHFEKTDTHLSPGDVVTHTTFLGVSPVSFDFREMGLRSSYRLSLRVLRETTVRKETDNHVTVRVRNILARGNDVVPLKVRPELRFLTLFKLGYTFAEWRNSHFLESIFDTTWKIDLDQPRGREIFGSLLGEGGRVQLRPALEAHEGDGVEVLARRRQDGRRDIQRRLIRLFSLLRFRDRGVASAHEIHNDEAALREIVRGRSREMRKRFGRRENQGRRSRITVQDGTTHVYDPDDECPERLAETPRHLVLKVENSLRHADAGSGDVRRAAQRIISILDLEETPEELRTIAESEHPESSRFAADLRLQFSWDQLLRLSLLSDDAIWEHLAGIFLGESLRHVWASPEARRPWLPGPTSPGKRHISLAWDDALRETPPSQAKQLGLIPEGLSSRLLFIRAERLVRRLGELRRAMEPNVCWGCTIKPFARLDDISILQLLMVRLAGGIEEGGVGWHLSIFTGSMARPAELSGGTPYTYRHTVQDEALPSIGLAATGWDGSRGLEGSPARFRAGALLQRKEPSEAWLMRLFSDLRFPPEADLRLEFRPSNASVESVSKILLLPFTAPEPHGETPFTIARYSYDIPLPMPELEPGAAYDILLRGLNEDGVAITEEQEIRFLLSPTLPTAEER